jgi:hypothetical protein
MLSQVVQSMLDLAGVVAGDRVLLLGNDEPGAAVRSALDAALAERGAGAEWIAAPAFDPRREDAPASLVAAFRDADVVVGFADHESLIHAPSFARRVREQGMRLVVATLRGDDWTSPFAGFPVATLFARARAAAERLRLGGAARLSAANGTELRFVVRPESILGMPGGSRPRPMERGRGDFALFPPGAIGVVPEAASGLIALDGLVGFRGPLATPIRLEIEAGSVRRVTGGREADWLRREIERHANGGHLAKLIAGIHPLGPLVQGMAELTRGKGRLSRAEGVALVGLGDSRAIGGGVASEWHWDGVISAPIEWEVGGRVLFRGGALQAGPEVVRSAAGLPATPHQPRLVARAGALGAFLVDARGAMPYVHRNPDSDELWIPLGGASLGATVGEQTIVLDAGSAALVPRGAPHRISGGERPTPLLVVERLGAAGSAAPPVEAARILALDPGGLTDPWHRPARSLLTTDCMAVETYARPEGMLRAEGRLLDPELWVVLRGGLALAWEGAYPAAEAGAGDLLALPAGGTARVVSVQPDTLALRVLEA